MTRHLKLCHTSDWHLGHTLHGHSREHEHARFLAFLLDTLTEQEVDALIVAGDVFDTANPPASAQAMLYGFLAEARARMPRLDVVIIAGNHDSAARLSAPDPVLRALGVRVIGAVPFRGGSLRAGPFRAGPRSGSGGRALDAEAMVVPLHSRGGEVAAWVAAVPFLRPSDLPGGDDGGEDPLVAGVRRVYGAVLDAARARRKPDQALVATGHCHMVDASTSELSERTILGGAKHALPVDLFGDDVSYVALGHLHLAQEVGQREHVRYSGSPIPLAMPEESYPHQLRIVRFESGRLAGQEAVRIPRTVDILRIPKDGPGELDALLAQLERLEVPAHEPTARASVAEASQGEEQRGIELAAQPFLEVRVRLSAPVPDLRQRIEAAIGDRPVRLVKIAVEHVGAKEALAESAPRRELAELDVEEVFLRCYARQFEGAPDEALLSAFHEVAEAARRALEEGEP